MNTGTRVLLTLCLMMACHAATIKGSPKVSSPLSEAPLSPTALVSSPAGDRLYIACATGRRVIAYDTRAKQVVWQLPIPDPPSGIALAKDGARLYVACAAPGSTICVVAAEQPQIFRQFPAGHTAMSPVLSPDGKTLFVCNRFDHDVSFLHVEDGRELRRVRVLREPVAADITPDGKTLVVANHLHENAANTIRAAAAVSLIATDSGDVKHVRLDEGSGLLRGVAVSPDGRFAAVTHLRSMYWLTTSSVDFGRMNCNALTFLDLGRGEPLGSILLDRIHQGAANPWAVTWLENGKTVVVTHAGTHELSLVDAPVDADASNFTSMRLRAYENPAAALPQFPKHPVRLRRRVALPGNGPRALAVSASVLYVANYFSDDLCRVDLSEEEAGVERLPLGITVRETVERRGERLFNDGRLCRQGWQSCASCHDADGRMDALNWDLLNDGAGNPKNTKSLVQSEETAPAMALGVRANASVAIRAGIQHILFTNASDATVQAIGAWLKTLQNIPSPCSVHGQLSVAAERGRELFMSERTGCMTCHPPPLFTDRGRYDVGTACVYDGMWDPAGADEPAQQFDTPGLTELWRTAPYLHDGSAASIREVLTTRNQSDQHGATSHLSPQQIDELVEYLMTL